MTTTKTKTASSAQHAKEKASTHGVVDQVTTAAKGIARVAKAAVHIAEDAIGIGSKKSKRPARAKTVAKAKSKVKKVAGAAKRTVKKAAKKVAAKIPAKPTAKRRAKK